MVLLLSLYYHIPSRSGHDHLCSKRKPCEKKSETQSKGMGRLYNKPNLAEEHGAMQIEHIRPLAKRVLD